MLRLGCRVLAWGWGEPGIFDVRSGSEAISIDGTPYAEW